MPRRKVAVGITGFGGLDNPEPGTPVARALRQGFPAPVEIHALGYDAWSSGAWAAGVSDALHVMPPLSAGDDAILKRIQEVHAQSPLSAIIPCLDLEVTVFSRLASRLRDAGIRTLLPDPAQLEAIRKVELPQLCYRNGIATPATVHVPFVSQVPFFADQLGYPLVVKGTVAGATKVENAEQAAIDAARFDLRWGGGVLLQKPVAGDEYVVAMVARGDGSCLGKVAVRKLGINQRGKGVIGAVVNDPDLDREAERILMALNWRGPLELEFIRAHGSARLNLIEVNCRFPSWILLTAWAGCNLPALLVQEMLKPGRPRARRPQAGVAYVRDVHECAIPRDQVARLQRQRDLRLQNVAPRRVRSSGAMPRGARVAITGVSAFEVVMPGLGVARALRRAGEITQVVGFGYGPFDTGIHRKDLFDHLFQIADPTDHDALVSTIAAARKKVGIEAVVPCLDFELEHFIAVRHRLEDIGIRMLLPSQEALRRTRKKHVFNGAVKQKDWGAFAMPTTMKVWTLQGVERSARALGFPLVIKGPVSGAFPAHSLEDARTMWLRLKEQGHPETLAQPFVYGEEFAVAAVCDDRHRLTGAVAIKKLVRCERGNTWGAVQVDLPDLVGSLQAFLKEVRWTGPVEAEFIRDSVTEKFMLLEVNPRFPAWVGYCADIGVNLPLQAVLGALGRPMPAPEPRRDLMFMRSCEEIPAKAGAFAAFATRGGLSHERT
jgi:carbamoyl-phosphate synthase large subunit